MSDPERDKVMVQELLELKTKMDGIIMKSFQENLRFYDTVRESFEVVINKRQNKPAELIGEFKIKRYCAVDGGCPLLRVLQYRLSSYSGGIYISEGVLYWCPLLRGCPQL